MSDRHTAAIEWLALNPDYKDDVLEVLMSVKDILFCDAVIEYGVRFIILGTPIKQTTFNSLLWLVMLTMRGKVRSLLCGIKEKLI